jgi:hypothetical protein
MNCTSKSKRKKPIGTAVENSCSMAVVHPIPSSVFPSLSPCQLHLSPPSSSTAHSVVFPDSQQSSNFFCVSCHCILHIFLLWHKSDYFVICLLFHIPLHCELHKKRMFLLLKAS